MLINILKKKKRRVFMKIRKYSNFKARIMKSNVKIDFMVKFNWYKGERVNGKKRKMVAITPLGQTLCFIWKYFINLSSLSLISVQLFKQEVNFLFLRLKLMKRHYHQRNRKREKS